MSDSQVKAIRDICVESFTKLGGEHNEISKLFATIELLLRNFYNCKRSVQELPCKLDYLLGVHQYLFFEHILEASVLKENINNTTEYYYVVINVSSILTFCSQKNQ